MKNFSDYAKNKKQNEDLNAQKVTQGQTQGSFGDGLPLGSYDALKSLVGKYEGASEGEIMRAILSEAKRSRKNGTLSNEQIDEFVSTISPMLGSAQRKKLASVAEKIKNT